MSSSQKPQPLLRKEVTDMGAEEKEHTADLIQCYANLQRIITADDPVKEAEYQLRVVKAILQTYGKSTEGLDIH